jgi:hypothetical protein
MSDDFEKRNSELVNFDKWHGAFGIQHGTRHYTKAGVSSLYSEVNFLTDVSEEDASDIPDYVLSETLQSDIEATVTTCLLELKSSKYIPSDIEVGSQFGALSEGEREGAYVKGWEDFEIEGAFGQPLYTADEISTAIQAGSFPLSFALERIVRDICDSGEFLSESWYFARIAQEYFNECPIRKNSAYLIGELFKEVCMKREYEGDLKSYFDGLRANRENKKKGTAANQQKAKELREYCVDLFIQLINENGYTLAMAPPEVQASELQSAAISRRPNDFSRAGKPYKKVWF